ncbi:SemiSWEET family sugar transporter [Pontimicrobium sp. IMCC45349]|uniref:SemiSWEET family sugar transporter n=1 Tax=Pontimicrobium sp. IMCC45349 TaxID=3391574 RepID=UPI0039A19EFB
MAQIDFIEIIGLTAATLTTAAFLPQVYKTWKTKDVSALSLPMLILFFTGIVLWLIYGIYIDSLSMILANSITIVSSFFLMYFKIKYQNKK